MVYCTSSVIHGHEAFGCLEDEDHEGPHKGGAFYAEPGGKLGCPSCGGLDCHTVACETPDVLEPKSGDLYEVTWDDAGVVTMALYEPPVDRVSAPSSGERLHAELERTRAKWARVMAIVEALPCVHRAGPVASWAGVECAVVDPGNESRDWCPTCRAKKEVRAV